MKSFDENFGWIYLFSSWMTWNYTKWNKRRTIGIIHRFKNILFFFPLRNKWTYTGSPMELLNSHEVSRIENDTSTEFKHWFYDICNEWMLSRNTIGLISKELSYTILSNSKAVIFCQFVSIIWNSMSTVHCNNDDLILLFELAWNLWSEAQ